MPGVLFQCTTNWLKFVLYDTIVQKYAHVTLIDKLLTCLMLKGIQQL